MSVMYPDGYRETEGLEVLLERLKEMVNFTSLFNVRLIPGDGAGDRDVSTSSLLLAAASPFIHSLLLDVEDVHENEFCIILPDFTSKQLEGLVDIMHSGHSVLNINDLLEMLGCMNTQNSFKNPSLHQGSSSKHFDADDFNSVSIVNLNTSNVTAPPCRKISRLRNKENMPRKRKFKVSACVHCGKRFRKSEKLKEHIETVHLQNSLNCSDCESTFKTSGGLREHEKLHIPVETSCTLCEDMLSSEWNLRDHMKLFHRRVKPEFSEEEKQHVCEICGSKFAHKNSLRHHLTHFHKEVQDDVMYCCTYCQQKFNRQIDLRTHLLLHNKPEIPCPHCSKLFHTKNYLKGHMLRVHTAWYELKYTCTECEKGFTDKHVWKGHLSMHEGRTPFKCRYCTREYQNQSNRMAHEKKSHPLLYTKINQELGASRIKDRKKTTTNN
ncbi:gastrula zinc finger protein XlCGF57.1 isoform X2 [Eurytemora carolleeae]|uniref:gastrula zinc finger protein XlCGF57.1 isoform X2 n=1 Tax=Eurytemora carolleeae TaxID=1294199 RepID=UPI000C77AC43|nr:gastrula zinc finger protein XlCGF57.1 isoform X2 [Eurytemora carolleeae]|eukprot:XP_023330375.1 gastrula zinc finger protein XlCGF57.1-like isoform X2 [Eurytemora affinis]